MIFSFTENEDSTTVPFKFNGDVYCFFNEATAVKCPRELWFSALCTSLKMKREVLILESPLNDLPAIEKNKRWDQGENWNWLSPRALSAITEAYRQNSMNFQQFKSFLKTSK